MKDKTGKGQADRQRAIIVGWWASLIVAIMYFMMAYIFPLLDIISAPSLTIKNIIEIGICLDIIGMGCIRFLFEDRTDYIEIEYGGHYVATRVGKKVAVLRCLEILSIRGNLVGEEGAPEYDTSFLMAIRAGLNQGVNIAYEVGVKQRSPFIRFIITGTGTDIKEVDKTLQRVAARIEAILTSAMRTIEIKQLQSTDLVKTIFGLFDNPQTDDLKQQLLKRVTESSTEKRPIHIEYIFDRRKREDETNLHWIINGLPRVMPTTNMTQVGKFISALLQQGISASLTCVFSPTSPKREKRKLEGQWQRIRTREKRKEDTLADYSVKDELIKKYRIIQDSKGWFDVSTHIVLYNQTNPDMILSEEYLRGLIYSIWGNHEAFEITSLKLKSTNLLRFLLRRHVKPKKMHVSNLIAFINPPIQEIPELSAPDYPEFKPPSKAIIKNDLFVGWSIYKGRKLNEVELETDWIREHVAILGATGTGKTSLVKQIITEISIKTDIPWWIFDVKGSEYTDLAEVGRQDVIILKPGADPNFVLDFIDIEIEGDQSSVETTFTILKELLHERGTSSDLTPAMESLLRESLRKMAMDPGNGSVFRLREIIQKTSAKETMQVTIDALLNRLAILTRSPLGDILSGGERALRISTFLNKRVILDLRYVARKGGMEAARLLYNLIAKKIFDAAMQRGITPGLQHILVLEEASNLVPESYTRQTAADITTGESMVMLQRATGQGVIVISTRPNISSNILANTATKIFFRLPYDSAIGARFLSLNERQERYLRSLKTGRAIMITPISEAFEIATMPPEEYRERIKEYVNRQVQSQIREDGPDVDIPKETRSIMIKVEEQPDKSKDAIFIDRTAEVIRSITSLLSTKGYLIEEQLHDALRVLDSNVTQSEIKETIRELIALGTIERESVGLVPGGFIYALPNTGQKMIKRLIIDYVKNELITQNFDPESVLVKDAEIYAGKTVILISPENVRASTIGERVDTFREYIQTLGTGFRHVVIIVRGSVAAAKIREHMADDPQFSEVSVIPAFPKSITKMVAELVKRELALPSETIETKQEHVTMAPSDLRVEEPGRSSIRLWIGLITGYVDINNGRTRWEEMMDFIETATNQSRGRHSTPISLEDGRRALSELLMDEKLYAFRVTDNMKFVTLEEGLWIVNQETLRILKQTALDALEEELRSRHKKVERGHGSIDVCADGVSYLLFPTRQALARLTNRESDFVCDVCATQELVCVLPAIEYADEIEKPPGYIRMTSLDDGLASVIT